MPKTPPPTTSHASASASVPQRIKPKILTEEEKTSIVTYSTNKNIIDINRNIQSNHIIFTGDDYHFPTHFLIKEENFHKVISDHFGCDNLDPINAAVCLNQMARGFAALSSASSLYSNTSDGSAIRTNNRLEQAIAHFEDAERLSPNLAYNCFFIFFTNNFNGQYRITDSNLLQLFEVRSGLFKSGTFKHPFIERCFKRFEEELALNRADIIKNLETFKSLDYTSSSDLTGNKTSTLSNLRNLIKGNIFEEHKNLQKNLRKWFLLQHKWNRYYFAKSICKRRESERMSQTGIIVREAIGLDPRSLLSREIEPPKSSKKLTKFEQMIMSPEENQKLLDNITQHKIEYDPSGHKKELFNLLKTEIEKSLHKLPKHRLQEQLRRMVLIFFRSCPEACDDIKAYTNTKKSKWTITQTGQSVSFNVLTKIISCNPDNLEKAAAFLRRKFSRSTTTPLGSTAAAAAASNESPRDPKDQLNDMISNAHLTKLDHKLVARLLNDLITVVTPDRIKVIEKYIFGLIQELSRRITPNSQEDITEDTTLENREALATLCLFWLQLHLYLKTKNDTSKSVDFNELLERDSKKSSSSLTEQFSAVFRKLRKKVEPAAKKEIIETLIAKLLGKNTTKSFKNSDLEDGKTGNIFKKIRDHNLNQLAVSKSNFLDDFYKELKENLRDDSHPTHEANTSPKANVFSAENFLQQTL